MGQKINPKSLRLIIQKDWQSRWFSNKKYGDQVYEDYIIRKELGKILPKGSIGDIQIERRTGEIEVNIHTSKPGIIIGRSGQGTQDIKNRLQKLTKDKININIFEIRKAELNANLVAQNIAYQIERRVAYRRAGKQAIERAVNAGAQGIKVRISGRLGGAEIARSEIVSAGSIPLQTFRADIDYAHVDAMTTYGTIGVKVWIYKGEKFQEKPNTSTEKDRNVNA